MLLLWLATGVLAAPATVEPPAETPVVTAPGKPRLSVRINGKLHVGSYESIQQLVLDFATEQAKREPVQESNRQTKKRARRVARATMPDLVVFDIEVPATYEPIVDLAQAQAALRQQMFALYSDALDQAMRIIRQRIDASNKIAIQNALDLLL